MRTMCILKDISRVYFNNYFLNSVPKMLKLIKSLLQIYVLKLLIGNYVLIQYICMRNPRILTSRGHLTSLTNITLTTKLNY